MADLPDHGVARRLLGARLTASLMPLNSTMIAVAVPDIAVELEHSRTTVTQALVATYLITAIALQSPGGKLGDRLGQWRVVTFGQTAIAAGAGLGLVADSLAALTVARMLMACGGALVVPAQGIGELLTFLTVAMVATSLVAGRLTDRMGPRPVALCGAPLCLVALGVLDRSGLSEPGDVRIPLALLGAGIGLSSPAAQTASLSSVAPSHSGMAAGVGSTMRYLGAVAGIALLGRGLDLDGSRAQVLTEHRAMLAVYAVALLASLACAAVLPRREARAEVRGAAGGQ